MLLLATALVSLFSTALAINVGAFNIQHFGDTKMNEVGSQIVQILSHYDIVLVQEVRDADHTALNSLKNMLGASTWEYVSSNPIGRTASYKEQYVFFYKKASVHILGQFQYDDSARDVFEREPFSVEIQYHSATKNKNVNVVLMGIHTQPEKAFEELQALPGAMTTAKNHFSNAAGIISMGDFNADCTYLSASQRASMELFTAAAYKSLISDSIDTTVATTTDCTYDRIVVQANGDVVADNAKVYRFDTALGLTADTTKAVSDHYPVEFRLN